MDHTRSYFCSIYFIIFLPPIFHPRLGPYPGPNETSKASPPLFVPPPYISPLVNTPPSSGTHQLWGHQVGPTITQPRAHSRVLPYIMYVTGEYCGSTSQWRGAVVILPGTPHLRSSETGGGPGPQKAGVYRGQGRPRLGNILLPHPGVGSNVVIIAYLIRLLISILVRPGLYRPGWRPRSGSSVISRVNKEVERI